MLLREIARPDAKFFIKSEWAPASNAWPAVAFSKVAFGRKMRGMFDPARDFVIFVGTTNSKHTRDKAHRSRLLSLVQMDHRTLYRTPELVSPEMWSEVVAEYGERWLYSFTMLKAWGFDTNPLPSAHDYLEKTYDSLRDPTTVGQFVQIFAEEIPGLLDLPIRPVPMELKSGGIRAQQRTDFLNAPKDLKAEIYRMAMRIEQRAAASNTTSIRWNKFRDANPRTETMEMLFALWEEQRGDCGLCQAPIAMPALPGLLQPSPDRIDSDKPDYSRENLHIVHLGCNYAKNRFSMGEFEVWLNLVRDENTDVETAE